MTENTKIRFKFNKINEYKYLSHLEIVRIMMMAVSRANINIKYSEGFSPNPKINFSFPVPVGLASIAEYSDIDIFGGMDALDFKKTLNLQLTEQMQVSDAKNIPGKVPSLMGDIGFCSYVFIINLRGKNLESEIKNDIMSNQELSESISSLELVENGRSSDIVNLNLIGYTKIYTNNRIFKFNDFLKYFKYLSNKIDIVVEDYFKKEAYVLREGMLKTPLEIV
ncbi:MAG: TIGR03936 family radical SAM-associated protein [Candidatus Humimicrobiaceae bacterium]